MMTSWRLTCVTALLWILATQLVASDKPNVLLICVDDLRPELGCFGVQYIRSPNIDRLASQGRIFRNHYVQAPTCGASRYTLLTGRYGGADNYALFERAATMQAEPASIPPSLPAWFRQHGYTTVSVGKVSHHPGGRGGDRWNDHSQLEMPESWDLHLLPAGPWQDPRGWMHGLAHGEIRIVTANRAVPSRWMSFRRWMDPTRSIRTAFRSTKPSGNSISELPGPTDRSSWRSASCGLTCPLGHPRNT